MQLIRYIFWGLFYNFFIVQNVLGFSGNIVNETSFMLSNGVKNLFCALWNSDLWVIPITMWSND